ncbi:MAG: hypothetical protein U5R14_13340 [Gemmatimonadota bacterium]|nr:hypothetical protein [Gemmatimonadota bacterium]
MSERDTEFRWPPPGLERLQGDLWGVVTSGWLAGLFLVAPLLLLTTRQTDVATLGPLADAWWVAVVVVAFGLTFAIDAFVRVARLLHRATRAVERGYGVDTVLYVVADRRRDMGFLLAGRRYFSVLEPRAREVLRSLRVLTAALHAAGGLWLCSSLALGLWVAARGWIGPETLLLVTVAPAAGFYLFGAVTGLTEDARIRRARKAWHGGAWEDDLDPERIRAWQQATRASTREPETLDRHAARLRRGTVAAGVAAVVVLLPVLSLVPTSAVGPALARVSIPEYERVQRSAAELEAFRGYGVPHDPTVTAGEAGRLLQNLAYVGSSEPVRPGEVEPPLRIEAPWIPDEGESNPVGAPPHTWSEALFPSVSDAPNEELRRYLASLADHRAHTDFSRLARAERIDAAAARWGDRLTPLAGGGGGTVLPTPRLSGLRVGGHAHLAAAGSALLEGRNAEAETLIREVVSVGFLLADQGPTLMDNLVGHAMIREGGRALASFFVETGREADAARLSEARRTAARTAGRIHMERPASTEAIARMLPGLVLDSATVRGLAWEGFALMATLAPCMNLNRVVFGPGEAYREFLARAHDALVWWDSEEPLFRRASTGLFPGASSSSPLGLGRWLSLSAGWGMGSCGAAPSHFDFSEETG